MFIKMIISSYDYNYAYKFRTALTLNLDDISHYEEFHPDEKHGIFRIKFKDNETVWSFYCRDRSDANSLYHGFNMCIKDKDCASKGCDGHEDFLYSLEYLGG